MIISENKEAELSSFLLLLDKTNNYLNIDAVEYPSKYKRLEGIKGSSAKAVVKPDFSEKK